MMMSRAGNHRILANLLIAILAFVLLFGAAGAESPATGEELDGSKIEWIHMFWLTADSTDDGDADHLYLAPLTDTELAMQYRVEFSLSGEYDYEPGTITLKLPAQIWQTRTQEANGSEDLYGTMTLSVPADPNTSADFNYRLADGYYYISNTRTLTAASTARFDFTVLGLTPHDIRDMMNSKDFSAELTVVTHLDNVMSAESETLSATLDTYEEVYRSTKSGQLIEFAPEDLLKLGGALPEGMTQEMIDQLPNGYDDLGNYVFVSWYSYLYHRGNQPFTLTLDDLAADAYRLDEDETTRIPVTDALFLGVSNGTGSGQLVYDDHGVATGYIEDVLTDRYHADTKANYDHVRYIWTAYSKADMPPAKGDEDVITYFFENTAAWKLEEMDNEGSVTQSSSTTRVEYAPQEYLHPPGHFVVLKYSDATIHGHNTARFTQAGYYPGCRQQETEYYGYALNQLLHDKEVAMRYEVVSVVAGGPFIVTDDQGVVHGWRIEVNDAQCFFNDLEKEDFLTSAEDYDIRSVEIEPVGWGYRNIIVNDDPFTGYYQSDWVPYPDMIVEYQLNCDGDWHFAAEIRWGDHGVGAPQFYRMADGCSGSLSPIGYPVVNFPDNATHFRVVYTSNLINGELTESNLMGLVLYCYPTIALKPSNNVKAIVREKYEWSDTPSTKFKNDCGQRMYKYNKATGDYEVQWFTNYYGEYTDTDFDTADSVLAGASYSVYTEKNVTFDRKKDNDAANRRAVLHYDAKTTELSNLTSLANYREAVSEGVIVEDTSAVWYDLLPLGVTPDLSTVRLSGGDRIVNAYTMPDFRGTGRTMMVVEANLTHSPKAIKSGTQYYYGVEHTIQFDAYYPWEEIVDNGTNINNYIVYESTTPNLNTNNAGVPTLGSARKFIGEPDNPLAGNNATVKSLQLLGPGDPLVAALTDLDPATDDNRFLYAEADVNLTLDTAALSGVVKAVASDLVGLFTQGLEGQEEVTVFEGHHYTYRLRVASSEASSTKNIVIFDTIENYHIPDQLNDQYDSSKQAELDDVLSKKDWEGDWQASGSWRGGQWRGTLNSVDVTDYIVEGCAPVIYYSTNWDLQFGESPRNATAEERQAVYTSGAYVLSDSGVWTRVDSQEIVDGVWSAPAGVTAIAIDCSLDADGNEFELAQGAAMNAYLHMTAPEGDSAKAAYNRPEGLTSMDDVDWDAALEPDNNMHAYNNMRMLCVTVSESSTSSLQMIRNDYTRVGIIPNIIHVEKDWKDNQNHDGKRTVTVTVRMYRRLATEPRDSAELVGTVVLSAENDWASVFEQIQMTDENGIRYIYTFEETVEDYSTTITNVDDNHVKVTNTHEDETVDVPVEKEWEGDNNDANGDRPSYIELRLWQEAPDGTRRVAGFATVRPDSHGSWSYNFTGLDKYAPYTGEPGEWVAEEWLYKYFVEELPVDKYVPDEQEIEVFPGEANTYINHYHPYGNLALTKRLENATPQAAANPFSFTVYFYSEKETVETENEAGETVTEPAPLLGTYAYTIYSTWVAEGDTGNVVAVDGTGAEKTGTIVSGDTIELLAGETFIVRDLPAKSTYRIVEDESLPGFVLTGKTNDSGTIPTAKEIRAEFVNKYSAMGSVQFVGRKHLWDKALRPNQFRFTITDNSTGMMVFSTTRNGPVDAVQLGGGIDLYGRHDIYEADIVFGTLYYSDRSLDENGTAEFSYTIREAQFDAPGIEMSQEEYVVTVKAVDNGDGTITTTKYLNGEELTDDRAKIIFTNKYDAKGEIDLVVWKELIGRPLKEGEFQFQLYTLQGTTQTPIGDPVANDAEGKVVFKASDFPLYLQFDERDVNSDGTPRIYTFLVREVKGQDATVEYTDQAYVIMVTVADLGDGTLSVVQGSQDATAGDAVFCTHCHGTGVTQPFIYKYFRNQSTTLSATNQQIGLIRCSVCGGYGVDEHGETCEECNGTGLFKPFYGRYGGTYTHGIAYVPYGFGQVEEGDRFNLAGRPVGSYYLIIQAITGYNQSYQEIYHMRYAWIDPIEGGGTACPYCGGSGYMPVAPSVLTEEEAPVFTNPVKPSFGHLEIHKITGENTEASADHEFVFHVKLGGDPLETLTYSLLFDSDSGDYTFDENAYPFREKGWQGTNDYWPYPSWSSSGGDIDVVIYFEEGNWDGWRMDLVKNPHYDTGVNYNFVSSIALPTDEDGIFNYPGMKLAGWKYLDRNYKYVTVSGSISYESIISNNGDSWVDLYPVFEPRGYTAEKVGDNEFVIKIPGNATAQIVELFPAGTSYEVWEETETGWVQVSSENLVGNIPADDTATASVTNEYKPGSTQYLLNGLKLLDETEAEADSFTFELWDGEPDAADSTLIESVQNQANGAISFTPIEISSGEFAENETEKTFTYYIREKADWYQNATDTDLAYAYDSKVVKATVVVTKSANEDNEIVLTATVTYDGAEAVPVFENETKPGSLKISKEAIATKAALDAVNASDSDFPVTVQFTDNYGRPYYPEGTALPYTILDKDGSETGTGSAVLDAKGLAALVIKPDTTLLFENLKPGTKYTVAETSQPTGWSLASATDLTGTIAANVTSEETFTNAYTARTTLILEPEKILEGGTVTEGQFVAELYQPEDPDTPWMTAATTAGGKFVFDELTFTLENGACTDGVQTGIASDDGSTFTFTYLLKEAMGTDDAMIYDGRTQIVTVTVTDQGNGRMTADKSFEGEEPGKFINRYKPGDLVISKTVIGQTSVNAGKIFTFDITLTDAEGNPISGDFTSVKSMGEPVTEHTQITPVDERMGTVTLNGVLRLLGRAFTGQDQITVSVTADDEDAPLPDQTSVTFHPGSGDAFQWVMDRMYFSVLDEGKTYNYTIKVTVDSLAGTDAQSHYTFTLQTTTEVLYNEFGQPTSIVVHSVGGTMPDITVTYGSSETVTFDQNGKATVTLMGGESVMIVGLPHQAQYTITEREEKGYTLTGSAGDTGEITADETAEAAFENTYEAAGEWTPKVTKVYLVQEGETAQSLDITEGQFTFRLLDSNNQLLEEVTVSASENGTDPKTATAVFSTFYYTLEDIGDYTYTIYELDEQKADYYGYDDKVYTVKVNVEDAGDGTLDITVTGLDNNAAGFVNTYSPKGSFTVHAKKTVNGQTPDDSQVYSFELSGYGLSSPVVLTNDKQDIKIDMALMGIQYSPDDYAACNEGRITYQLRELPSEDNVRIDPAVYTITVTSLTDNHDGTLTVDYRMTDADGGEVTEMAFDNLPLKTLKVTKVNSGGDAEDAFTISLTVTDGQGNSVQDAFSLTIAGEDKGELTSGGSFTILGGQTAEIGGIPIGFTAAVTETSDPRYTTETAPTGTDGSVSVVITNTDADNAVTFTNTLITTGFYVIKQWEGTTGGDISLTLYAEENGQLREVTPQPLFSREDDRYVVSGLPRFNADGSEIIYAVKERGMDGFLTIYDNSGCTVNGRTGKTNAAYNGGVIVNRAVTSLRIRKVWSGSGNHPAITLTLYCNGEKMDRKPSGPDKDGWYRWSNLPLTVNGKEAEYYAVEEHLNGWTTTYSNTGTYQTVTDRAYNGGTITNKTVPRTGDNTPLLLYILLLAASTVCLTWIIRRHRRQI